MNPPYYDIELVRARLIESDIPTQVAQKYLQILTNLNAMSYLMSPSVDLQDEPGQEELERLFQRHQERCTTLEAEWPELAVAARPEGWAGN